MKVVVEERSRKESSTEINKPCQVIRRNSANVGNELIEIDKDFAAEQCTDSVRVL